MSHASLLQPPQTGRVVFVPVRHDQLRAHHLSHLGAGRISVGRHDTHHHIALGEDAGHAVAIEDRDCADLMLAHQAGRI